jgi:holo-[acyl-carrier protein] synthase
MILGIGTDLIDIRRIERTLDRFAERFTQRVFTEAERSRSESRPARASSYAKRFAAKEACAKALGSGLQRKGIHWRHIGVVSGPNGRPALELTGAAAARLAAMAPSGMTAKIDLSMSDDYPLAEAFVVISAWPAETKASSPAPETE